MSVRRLIVEIVAEDVNVTQFCAQHGISTWFFYELRRRHAAGGLAAIEPRSRAPRRVANRTPSEVEDAIVSMRKQLLDAGLDAGPGTIAFHLRTRGEPRVPSDATIWRVLRRRGFVVADPTKAPRPKPRRFAATRANECWQSDDTDWALADGTPVKVTNIIDDCTRLLVASRASFTTTAAAIFEAFAAAAIERGWPQRVLNDNAKAHYALHESFAALGIETTHSRPYHPQTCGKVERFHSTLKRALVAKPAPETLDELQDQLDTFRDEYNHRRPHRALGRRPPAEAWAATPKSGPATRPLHYAPTELHHGTVAPTGVIQGGSRYSIVIGRAHAGRRALVLITGAACHVFIDGKLIRALQLDPTRRVQPLNRHKPLP